MAGADRYAEAVRRSTFGSETRVPIVLVIEYWLKSADRIRTIIRKEIEREVQKSEDPEDIQDLITDFKRKNEEKVRDLVADGEEQESEFLTSNEAKVQAFYNRNVDKPDRFYDANKDKPGVFYAQNIQKAQAFYDANKDKDDTFYDQNIVKAENFYDTNVAKSDSFNSQNRAKAQAFYDENKDKPGNFNDAGQVKAQAFYDENKDKLDNFNDAGQVKAQRFYDRNHPSVDNDLSRLTTLYSTRIKKMEPKDPQPFPVGVRIDTDYTGLDTIVIEGDDYNLNDTREEDSVIRISGDDYSFVVDDWCEKINDDDYLLKLGEDHVILYDYDYTLVITRANGA